MRPVDALSYPEQELDPGKPTGLMLAGMGGPDCSEAVEPFLRNVFCDPAVLPIRAPFGRALGSVLARLRAGKARRRYESLGWGGGSPQLSWTSRQCAELERILRTCGLDVHARPAMRYWHPFPDEAVASLMSEGARQFLVAPAYPQYSGATSGSALTAACAAIRSLAGNVPLHVVRDWHLLPGYIDALAAGAEPVIVDWAIRGCAPRECAFLPVAHSLPQRLIRDGDPYLEQTRASAEAVRSKLAAAMSAAGDWWDELPGGGNPLLAFQGRVGPVRWVGPDAASEVRRLGAGGCRRLVVLPLSFTCEHIETLHELDVQLAAIARRAGVLEFVRVQALNLNPCWLSSLAEHLALSAFGDRQGALSLQCREVAHAGG